MKTIKLYVKGYYADYFAYIEVEDKIVDKMVKIIRSKNGWINFNAPDNRKISIRSKEIFQYVIEDAKGDKK